MLLRALSDPLFNATTKFVPKTMAVKIDPPWYWELHANEIYRAIQDGSLSMEDFKKWLYHEKSLSWSYGFSEGSYEDR